MAVRPGPGSWSESPASRDRRAVLQIIESSSGSDDVTVRLGESSKLTPSHSGSGPVGTQLQAAAVSHGGHDTVTWPGYSEVVNCNSVVVDLYIVSFDLTDRCCFWKMVLCRFGLLGRFAWSKLICCFNAEYRWAFLRLRFLAPTTTTESGGSGGPPVTGRMSGPA